MDRLRANHHGHRRQRGNGARLRSSGVLALAAGLGAIVHSAGYWGAFGRRARVAGEVRRLAAIGHHSLPDLLPPQPLRLERSHGPTGQRWPALPLGRGPRRGPAAFLAPARCRLQPVRPQHARCVFRDLPWILRGQRLVFRSWGGGCFSAAGPRPYSLDTGPDYRGRSPGHYCGGRNGQRLRRHLLCCGIHEELPYRYLPLEACFLLRRRHLDVQALYEESGAYGYGKGVNGYALFCWVLGVAVYQGIANLYPSIGASLPSFVLAGAIYLGLALLRKRRMPRGRVLSL